MCVRQGIVVYISYEDDDDDDGNARGLIKPGLCGMSVPFLLSFRLLSFLSYFFLSCYFPSSFFLHSFLPPPSLPSVVAIPGWPYAGSYWSRDG